MGKGDCTRDPVLFTDCKCGCGCLSFVIAPIYMKGTEFFDIKL